MSVDRKKKILEGVRAELRREMGVIERAAKDAWEGATHEENKPEHNKDMRATEASYVAMGQSARLRELTEALAKIDALSLGAWPANTPASVGALVTIEGEDEHENTQRLVVLIVPAGGGVTVEDGGDRVRAVTPQAPLGEALMGTSVGDPVKVLRRAYEVLSIE
jgi:transcription elongation GreA/GreB family factor